MHIDSLLPLWRQQGQKPLMGLYLFSGQSYRSNCMAQCHAFLQYNIARHSSCVHVCTFLWPEVQSRSDDSICSMFCQCTKSRPPQNVMHSSSRHVIEGMLLPLLLCLYHRMVLYAPSCAPPFGQVAPADFQLRTLVVYYIYTSFGLLSVDIIHCEG